MYTLATTYIGIQEEIFMSNANDWNKAIIEEFRANGGKVGGYFAGVPVLLLHTPQGPRVNNRASIHWSTRWMAIVS